MPPTQNPTSNFPEHDKNASGEESVGQSADPQILGTGETSQDATIGAAELSRTSNPAPFVFERRKGKVLPDAAMSHPGTFVFGRKTEIRKMGGEHSRDPIGQLWLSQKTLVEPVDVSKFNMAAPPETTGLSYSGIQRDTAIHPPVMVAQADQTSSETAQQLPFTFQRKARPRNEQPINPGPAVAAPIRSYSGIQRDTAIHPPVMVAPADQISSEAAQQLPFTFQRTSRPRKDQPINPVTAVAAPIRSRSGVAAAVDQPPEQHVVIQPLTTHVHQKFETTPAFRLARRTQVKEIHERDSTTVAPTNNPAAAATSPLVLTRRTAVKSTPQSKPSLLPDNNAPSQLPLVQPVSKSASTSAVQPPFTSARPALFPADSTTSQNVLDSAEGEHFKDQDMQADQTGPARFPDILQSPTIRRPRLRIYPYAQQIYSAANLDDGLSSAVDDLNCQITHRPPVYFEYSKEEIEEMEEYILDRSFDWRAYPSRLRHLKVSRQNQLMMEMGYNRILNNARGELQKMRTELWKCLEE